MYVYFNIITSKRINERLKKIREAVHTVIAVKLSELTADDVFNSKVKMVMMY